MALCLSTCKKDSNSGNNVPTESAKLGNVQIFPSNNAWNTDISAAAIDPNSDNLIASVGNSTNLHPDFGTVWEGEPIGIPYNIVSATQAKVKVNFEYDTESDPSPYPMP